ncbi:MAG: elongation factor P hydroxylase [Pseudomonadales bacterium]|nr:elongation factor P hydroxylase [Pseudomonadales bacterium]
MNTVLNKEQRQKTGTNDLDDVEEQQVQQLIDVFNRLFSETENTRLVRGEGEPIYLPANPSCSYHRIEFAHGFFNSALHEIAHWCVAGSERRQLVDFGYWYQPDGRSLAQQAEFENVEVKPQALEWIFAQASGRRFRVSLDNLSLQAEGITIDDSKFKRHLCDEVKRRICDGLPPRAERFVDALAMAFNPAFTLDITAFKLEDL